MNLRTNLPSIPFIDVAAQRRRLGPAIDAAVARVMSHCQFILGPEVKAFETELAAFCGARHVVTCASGTDALVLALRAMGIGRAMPCYALRSPLRDRQVVALVGNPVFVDVDAATFNIDAKELLALSPPQRGWIKAKGDFRSIYSACRPTIKPLQLQQRPKTSWC